MTEPLHEPPAGPPLFMIVCSCNVLTDHDVRNAVSGSGDPPRNPKQLHRCVRWTGAVRACARTIKTILEEALGACAKACNSACPHSKAGGRDDGDVAFVGVA